MVGAGGLLAGGAVLGVLASSLDKVKAMGWKIVTLCIQSTHINNHTLQKVLMEYLMTKKRMSGGYDKSFYEDTVFDSSG